MARVTNAENFAYRCYCFIVGCLRLLTDILFAPFEWIATLVRWTGYVVLSPLSFIVIGLEWIQKKWWGNAQNRLEQISTTTKNKEETK